MPITRLNNTISLARTFAFDPELPGALQPILSYNNNYTGSQPQSGMSIAQYPITEQLGTSNPALYYKVNYNAATSLGAAYGILFGSMGDSWMHGGYTTSYYSYSRPGAYIIRRPGQAINATFNMRMPKVLSTTSADCPTFYWGLSHNNATGTAYYGVGFHINNGAHTTAGNGTINWRTGVTAATSSMSLGVAPTAQVPGDVEYPCSINIDAAGNVNNTICGITSSYTLGTNLTTAGALFWMILCHGTASAPANFAGIRNVRITVT
jgi:hypothetical protein